MSALPIWVAGILMAAALTAKAQQGPIESTWVYVTPLHWKHAPRDIPESWSFAQVVVLYPEGQYLEVQADLIKQDKTERVSFSVGDGQLLRSGTWSRTDDRAIRVHSRDVLKDDHILNMVECDAGKRNCVTVERPIPGPFAYDTCAMEGASTTHLAKTIHCHRLSVSPAKLNLDWAELERMAADAFRADAHE